MRPQPKSLLDIAQELVEREFYVFPVRVTPKANGKFDKRPAKIGGAGHLEASLKPEEHDWSRATHVGIDCGRSRLVVLDEDQAGGLEIPLTYTVGTARPGGKHYYFRANVGENVKNAQGWPAEGYDVRGNGGWVVWYDSVILDEDLAPWPYGVRQEPNNRANIGLTLTAPEIALQRHLDLMGVEGQAHENVRDFAAKAAAQGIPKLMAESLVLERCWAGLDRHAQELIDSAYAKFWAGGTKDKPDEGGHPVSSKSEPEKPKRGMTLADMLKTDFPPPKMFIDKFLPAGFSLVAGAPKVGKSFLMWQLAWALISGTDFLGMKAKDPVRVCWLALEDTFGRISRRGKTLVDPRNVEALERLEVMTGTPKDMDAFFNARADEFDVFIIDTGPRAFDLIDDYNKITRTFGELQQAFVSAGKALVVVWHTRKDSYASDGSRIDSGFDAILGSRGLMGVMDMASILRPEKLIVTGRDLEDLDLKVERGNGGWWNVLGDAHLSALGSIKMLLAKEGEMGRGDIISALPQFTKRGVEHGLSTGIERGEIQKVARGTYGLA